MPRLQHILRFFPVAAIAVLGIAWAMSIVHPIDWSWSDRRDQSTTTLFLADSSFKVRFQTSDARFQLLQPPVLQISFAEVIFGGFYSGIDVFGFKCLSIPLPGLVTLVLPFAVGSFTNFRFRIWHWLAYSALVCTELAFYLKWQAQPAIFFGAAAIPLAVVIARWQPLRTNAT